MPLVQISEMNKIHDKDWGKINSHSGSGIFLNPYSGGMYHKTHYLHSHPYYHHNKIIPHEGNGLGDFFKGGLDFFKNNMGAIADAAIAASNIADVVKTAKEIKRGDEELYELKRVKDEMAIKNLNKEKQEKKFTPAQLEIINKMAKSGSGIKIL